MKHRTILSLCDYSGAWSQPYRDAGYTVIQVDLKHGQDVRLLKYPGRVHGILAAPPCTHLAGSGARWWEEKGEQALLEALSISDACSRLSLFCKPEWWVMENPVGRLVHYIGPPQFTFNPSDFGDPYTKKTCLWGNFIAPLPIMVGEVRAVAPTEGSMMWAKYGGKSERTKTMRSITPAGFARAFFEVNP